MNILILHGWNLSGARYKPLKKLLEQKGHVVYSPDLPGFGSCPVPEKPYSLHDYVEFVNRFLVSHKIPKVVVIGHSFGGRVAIKYAVSYQNKVKKLILTGVPGIPGVSMSKINLLKRIAKLGGMLFSFPVLFYVAPVIRKIFYKVIGAYDYYRTEGVMRETFKKIVSEDLIGPMKKVTIETLLIWGENDKITPVWIGKKMNQIIRGSNLCIIAGGNHCVVWELPAKFLNNIS